MTRILPPPRSQTIPSSHRRGWNSNRWAAAARTRIDFTGVLGDTWSVYSQNIGGCVLLVLILIGIIILSSLIVFSANFSVAFVVFAIAGEDSPDAETLKWIGNLFTLLYSPMNFIATCWLEGGLIRLMLQITRRGRFELGYVFSGGRFMLRLIGLNLMVVVISYAISFVCILPATLSGEELLQIPGTLVASLINVIIMLFFLLSKYFIVDREMGVVKSMGASFKYMNGNKLITLGIYIGAILIGTCQ